MTGRRRRRSSASSTTSNAKGANSAPETLRPPPIANEPTNSLPALDAADDPFAYDSDLETLSSVSSHSSIASSNGSLLDQELAETSHTPPSGDAPPEESAQSADSAIQPSEQSRRGSEEPQEAETRASTDEIADETRRSEALTELTSIEIEFAQLRERLYCERMQQVQIEQDYLLSGRHAEYEKSVSELSRGYSEQLERLQFAHNAWLEQREHLHNTWIRTVNYTLLVRRQELRRRLISAQQRRLWRLRDMRVMEDRRHSEKPSVDEDLALIAQSDMLQQIKQARLLAVTAQRCMVHSRKRPLALSAIDESEMDADYRAMNLPVYPREPKPGFRRIYVPPPIAEPLVSGKKRKPRQPRQPKKKPALDKDMPLAHASKTSGQPSLLQSQNSARAVLPADKPDMRVSTNANRLTQMFV
ncbi:hypothetical protein H4R22_001091 [Coemansia sp. RSA 1290]|nr:hypothetical protein LPJ68_003244 [Coemansia sp. RSA 1086]KAJ2632671.1 hypothetical protein H4R22_001091 [Coemansia sp. RSA 1290]KAJ2649668.1 hypothetical protein IWW40_003009 [Coemansia sp. RSA 1250]